MDAPGLRVDVQGQQATLELRADGRYTAASVVRGEVAAAATRGRMQGACRAQGTWSGARGRLTLRPAAQHASGHSEITRDGTRIRQALPGAGPGTPSTYQYACDARMRATRLRVPGSSVPMVHRHLAPFDVPSRFVRLQAPLKIDAQAIRLPPAR